MDESPWTDVIASTIESERTVRRVEHAVLAYSGGPDSTFLLHHFLFVAAKLDFGFTAVHVDHGLRKREGTRDRKHCEQVTEEHDIDLVVRQLTPPKGASEGWARRARYEALLEVAREERAQLVVTAHHLDDDVETILLKLTRGVRPARMHGMRRSRRLAPGTDVRLVRPLLGVSRAEIEAWLAAHELPFVKDSTNDDLGVPRNRLRHEVVPALDALAPPGWKRRLVATFGEAALQLRHRERTAERALLATLLRGAGVEPTTARLEALREALLAGRAQTLLGTRFGFEIRRRGDRIEVVAPTEAAPTPAPASPAPSRPLARPRPTRARASSEPPSARRASTPRVPSEDEGTVPPPPPPPRPPVEPPEPGTPLEPGASVVTPVGRVRCEVVTHAQATKRIQALRR